MSFSAHAQPDTDDTAPISPASDGSDTAVRTSPVFDDTGDDMPSVEESDSAHEVASDDGDEGGFPIAAAPPPSLALPTVMDTTAPYEPTDRTPTRSILNNGTRASTKRVAFSSAIVREFERVLPEADTEFPDDTDEDNVALMGQDAAYIDTLFGLEEPNLIRRARAAARTAIAGPAGAAVRSPSLTEDTPELANTAATAGIRRLSPSPVPAEQGVDTPTVNSTAALPVPAGPVYARHRRSNSLSGGIPNNCFDFESVFSASPK